MSSIFCIGILYQVFRHLAWQLTWAISQLVNLCLQLKDLYYVLYLLLLWDPYLFYFIGFRMSKKSRDDNFSNLIISLIFLDSNGGLVNLSTNTLKRKKFINKEETNWLFKMMKNQVRERQGLSGCANSHAVFDSCQFSLRNVNAQLDPNHAMQMDL